MRRVQIELLLNLIDLLGRRMTEINPSEIWGVHNFPDHEPVSEVQLWTLIDLKLRHFSADKIFDGTSIHDGVSLIVTIFGLHSVADGRAQTTDSHHQPELVLKTSPEGQEGLLGHGPGPDDLGLLGASDPVLGRTV